MRYEGSNPSLCTTPSAAGFSGRTLRNLVMDLSPASRGRMLIALCVLAILGLLTWRTMDPGKAQSLTWVLLGFFAFRVVLGRMRSR
jgi:hypothetical protein